MPKLQIITIPAPNLREKSKEVVLAKVPKLKKLISNMIEVMYELNGIGLAAPQIGKNICLAIIGQEATMDKRDLVILNPKITKHSWKRIKMEEGCLSVPGCSKEVERYKKITVKALDANGKILRFEAENFFARVLQHEIDHLNGILIIDK